ncbi:MAG: molybdenum cofactor biosynthesis protein MoaC [Desulfobacteraceae bacterium 4484_190.1]|nr:MAG: molybdenum cofactor biosynthesis protein MoaC [Desulfobacteraceae bacterium 4484_190.1]
MGMVNITQKPVIKRLAEAEGKILLSPETIQKVRDCSIKKGDPIIVAEIAAINAAKQTCLLIPHCHQIPLDMVEVDFEISKGYIKAKCLVKAEAKTGVEMEALVGISMALNTIWDMVKYLEKDSLGQYPETRITGIKVIRKDKEPVPNP